MKRPDPSLVRSFGFFRGVGDDDLRTVLSSAVTRRIPRKGTAFKQGEPATEFFVLLHGHLKVVQVSPEGRQVIVRIVEPGELYGVAVAMKRPDYPATAMAMEESITLAWPSSAWPGLVERVPQLAANALSTLGQRVQEAHTRIREVSTEEIERRIAHLLLRIADKTRSDRDAAVEIAFPISRQDVAEMTGTTLFTVSRILSAWEQKGLVTGGREHIGLARPAELRAIAERAPD